VSHQNIYLPHRPKTVALICMGPSILDYFGATLTQELTLKFADEVWALNMAANTIEHDVCFWMDDLNQQNNFRSGLIDLLRKRGKPVVTCTRYPTLVPTSYDYPISDIGAMAIPVWGKPYLNNGVAMAVAYAIWLGVKVLKVYGADFSYPNRDFAESGRACVECWVTLASMKGMEVQLCPNTSLMDNVKDHGIYGYAEQPTIHIDGQSFKYIAASATGGATGAGKYRGGGNEAIYDEHGNVRAIESRGLAYFPEDSSGGLLTNGHVVQADVPRSAGNGKSAGADGPPVHAEIAASVADAGAAVGHRGGVRAGRKPRRDKGRAAAGAAGGGAAGAVPASAEGPVPADEGIEVGGRVEDMEGSRAADAAL
jgi:hypothetical protein